ncbi:protein GLUTELIN PRECURSOR ACCUMULATION 3-like isoform X2 [Rhinatrema bivittatum]|uniref:protein GLUTELIN PRECURSOR ACCUMULATION 3-like isoform X2 n=1 Tax=Rhinatrema bivittatum TaxID=194408 RepID=UPI00112C36CB|nr:protein GLUTELIN PRECURSOR ACCUMULATION 3-like isoform X2 [Rhinatrema bivittatum]
MAPLELYALWSLRDPPRQLIRRCRGLCFQVPLPVPLPQQLVVFGLGDWGFYPRETTITAEVLLSADSKPQRIGTLSHDARSLVWEGDWRLDMLMTSMKQADSGTPAKLLLTVDGQEKGQSSDVSRQPHKPPSPPLKDPDEPEAGQARRKTWKQSPSLKRKPRKLQFDNRESTEKPLVAGTDVHVKQLHACPSPRWCHAMCLSDPETAILIGGEGANQQPCKDSLWKLEIDNDFWFPMETASSGPTPPCSRGHSATYDPEAKCIYIFGGMRDGKRYNTTYMLDTLTWKWTLVPAVGKVPTLAFHSATVYRRELYIFGGIYPQLASEAAAACSNLLYIFNPDFKIWYQPIVEGKKPLPRFGHSATLLRNQLVIFGGQRTPAYLGDLHLLDLGFMEYRPIPVSTASGKPSPRCFHAALSVSDHKMVISGGVCTLGSLRDAFIFNLDTSSWSSVPLSSLSLLARLGTA